MIRTTPRTAIEDPTKYSDFIYSPLNQLITKLIRGAVPIIV